MGVAIMVQGTGSNVGKSVIVAGLCRIARRRGIDVAPFKPQNMSNNAAVCADGGEIGRAQALQARAAGLAPSVHHNPVLLKPETDRGARVVVQGRVAGALRARDYGSRRESLLAPVLESFGHLTRQHALVIVEGAGSPAEVNLRAGDIANMGFATAADVPVLLLADIDRGGVIASLVGTQAVLAPEDARMIVGFAINRFRGDISLFDDGLRFVSERTGWPCLGVVPWLDAPARLPAEDAVDVGVATGGRGQDATVRVAVPLLSRLANFDDVDPLRAEPQVDLRFVPPGRPLPRDADVILLLGTKSTLSDLDMLVAQGWHHDVLAHVRAGGRVLGLCGGFQMLGELVRDATGVDGVPGERAGLGLLAMRTEMTGAKVVRAGRGTCAVTGTPVQGYEIHSGTSQGAALARPMLQLTGGPDGARSPDGLIEGCYLHGLFASDEWRSAWLERIRSGSASALRFEAEVDGALDALADGLEAALDIDGLFDLARTPALWRRTRTRSRWP